jgi:hypothetical protein
MCALVDGSAKAAEEASTVNESTISSFSYVNIDALAVAGNVAW